MFRWWLSTESSFLRCSTGTLAASISTIKTSALNESKKKWTGEAKKSEGEVHLILPAPTQQVQAIGRSPQPSVPMRIPSQLAQQQQVQQQPQPQARPLAA